jgi:hypothetical protein
MNYLSSLTSNDAAESEFQFYETLSCAINSQQDLFLLDGSDNKIIKFNRNGQPERAFGDYESGDGQLVQPVQMDIVNQKYLIVSDIEYKAILVYDFFGNYLKRVICDQWIAPSGLAVTDQGEILVADPAAKKIFLVAADLMTVYDIETALQLPLQKPQDIAVYFDRTEGKKYYQLYVIDSNQIIIGKFIHP